MQIIGIIKRSFVQLYEHLFKLVLVDISWFILITIPLFVGYLSLQGGWILPLLFPLILTGPLLLAGLKFTGRISAGGREEVLVRDFFREIISSFKRGLLGFIFSSVLYLILVIDFLFFLQRGEDNLLMLIAATLFLYLLVFFSMQQIFFWGLLVNSRDSLLKVIKQSLYLTLDNAIFSFLLLLCLLILLLILIVTGVGMPLLLIGLTGLMLNNATRHVLSKYEDDEE